MNSESIDSTASKTISPLWFERKSTLPWLGRACRKIGEHALPVAKVILVVGIILACCAVPVAAQAIQPTRMRCEGNHCSAMQATEQRTFPSYAPLFMHVGQQLSSIPTGSCQIDDRLVPERECTAAHEEMLISIKAERLESNVFTAKAFRERGTKVSSTVNGRHWTVSCGLNPQQKENYKRAIHYIQTNFLVSGNLFDGTPEEIVGEFQKIHQLLKEKLPNAAEITPGQFRTGWLVVYEEESGPEILPAKAKNILSPEEFNIFINSYKKIPADGSFAALNKKELKVWNKVAYIPPAPKLIAGQMKQFAQELKSRYETMPTVELSSWVHTELIRIHPFEDGNGSLARLLLNTIRINAGLDLVIFDSVARYREAVKESMKRPEAFTEYLVKHAIAWTESQKETLSGLT